MPDLAISAERLAERIEALGRIGRNAAGGMDRPVYSSAWADARDLVAGWMREAGLQVRTDAVGTLFGRLAGTDEPGATVLSGSHIDTVPNGGPLDGALGIHAALSAVEALQAAHGRPRRSLEVVAICEEEGARFTCSFWGARAMTGRIQPGEPDAITDTQGVRIGDAMRQHGLDPAAISTARRVDVAAFLELHIEQGRLLFDAGEPLGVVHTITGSHRYEVLVAGRADHAGTTPMDLRRDAYLGAAGMALAIADTARQMGRPAVATVGRVRLAPGAPNVVPGEAAFSVDARHLEPERLEALVAEIQAVCQRIAAQRGLELAITPTMREAPQPLDPAMQRLLQASAEALGIPWRRMGSGAGHDSEVMARAFPTGMLFVPSVEGRSHRPDEWTPVEQIVPGVLVLAEALRRLAY